MQFDFDDNRYSAPTEVDMDYAMTIDDAMAMKAGLPIPKRVGIQRNLITGEIVDYNAGLVFNPTNGRVLQILSDGKRQIVPKSDNRYGWMVRGVDRLLNQPQPELTTETPTDGDGRFLGDAIYSGKRNRSIPWQADMGYSPRSAQVYQNYPPEVMARIGQHGKLENYGSMMVYDSFVGKDGKRHWYGRPEKEHPTTLMYQNAGEGNVVPALSMPGDGKNDVIPIDEAVAKGIISPEQARDFNSIPTPQYATSDQLSQWAVGKVKVGEDSTIRPLQNRDGSYQTNYRSTYVDARTGDVYNVTSDKTGKFHLIRPEISEKGYGFPRHKQTTNLTQEMIGINQGMKIGGNETITDTIREDPSIPGLEYFSEPVIAGLNPITGRPEIKYVHKGNNGTWVDDDANTNDLFNYWQLNQESQGQSMVANDLARGGRRTAGGKVTPAYQSLQDGDYLGNRLRFSQDGIVVDRPAPADYVTPKGIQNFTPASDFYSQGSQLVRDLRTGKVIHDPNRSVVIDTPDGQYGVVPYSQDKETIIRRYGVKNYQPRIDNGIVVGKGNYETGYVWGNESVSPASASHTKFYKLPINPTNAPIGAYRVNEYGTVLVDDDGYPIEAENISLPRSAQIANVGNRSFPGIENAPRNYEDYPVEYPYRFDLNFKGSTPQYEYPDGMSEAEAYRLGLIKEVYQGKGKRALDDRYQIPVPNGVGFTRVLPFEDPRTQAALAAQEARLNMPSAYQQAQSILRDKTLTVGERGTRYRKIVDPLVDLLGEDEFDVLWGMARKGYKVPEIQRQYEIKPSRTAGIDSPQYAMFADLETQTGDDTARFWKENIPGVIPQGVVEGAYIPITMNPRNEQGRKPAPEVLMPGINGRIMKGKDIKFYGYAPLDLEYAMNHVDPRDMNKLLGEGLTEDVIKQRVLDNALANAQIELDGQYYPLTREATEPFFDATPTSKYYQASNNVAFRGANVNSPIINDVIGEPSDDWIMGQMAKGNLNFSPENWMSDNERTTLKQREIYADPSIEPRDIVDAIDVAQRKKNVIDAMISNKRQRLANNITSGMETEIPLEELQLRSRHLSDEIRRATIAQNQLYQIENTPEITITRQGKPWQLQEFLDTANSVLGMETVDDSFRSRIYSDPNEVYSASVAGSFPMRDYLTPYEQTKALDIPYEVEVNGQERQFRLLPSRRTSQLFTPVPTSNMRDLSREPMPFPEEIITTSLVVPQGNVVAPLPSSSQNYSSGSDLGLLGFDGGSIPGDYVPDSPRTPIPSQVRQEPQQTRTSVRTSVNPVAEPETVMAGTKIPKWAIPASLGAAWLALAGYQRSRKEQEERQRQSVNME